MIEFNLLLEKVPQIREFYDFKIANNAKATREVKQYSIAQFFDIIGPKDISKLDKSDINKFLKDPGFTQLENSSKNLKLIHIRLLLEYYKRDDLIELLPHYTEKDSEIDINSLISREDIERLLKSCKGIKEKTLIMLLYESATRKSEFLNIRRQDIEFYENYCNIYIYISKTKKRNIPVVESIPFLKEYLNAVSFKQEDRLFDYSRSYFNNLLNKINERCKKKFPGYKKEINPHLFRHSRLTELASNRKLNEAQLRKFAGWSKSSQMPAIYFHLDDSSIRNEIIQEHSEIKEPKKVGFESVICPECTEINSKFNDTCWKCGKIINENIISQRLNFEQELSQLRITVQQQEKALRNVLSELKRIKNKK